MSEQKALTLAQAMSPSNYEQAEAFANRICNTEFVPKGYRGNASTVLGVLQKGAEIGLPPMASLSGIAFINGHASVWGDAMPAICMGHPLWGGMEESFDEEGTAICIVTRKGEKPHKVTYGDADAKQANLIGKEGTWRTNPKRMKQMRARSFALRDKFPDKLMGLISAEEAQDIDEPKVVGGGVAEPIVDGVVAGTSGLTAALEGMDAEAGERPKETPVAEVQQAKPQPQNGPAAPVAKAPKAAAPKPEPKPLELNPEQQAVWDEAVKVLGTNYLETQGAGRKCWGANRPRWLAILGEVGMKALEQERIRQGWEQ